LENKSVKDDRIPVEREGVAIAGGHFSRHQATVATFYPHWEVLIGKITVIV